MKNENNNIDGIKKMSNEERKKSKKLVLDEIMNELTPVEEPEVKKKNVLKKLDDIKTKNDLETPKKIKKMATNFLQPKDITGKTESSTESSSIVQISERPEKKKKAKKITKKEIKQAKVDLDKEIEENETKSLVKETLKKAEEEKMMKEEKRLEREKKKEIKKIVEEKKRKEEERKLKIEKKKKEKLEKKAIKREKRKARFDWIIELLKRFIDGLYRALLILLSTSLIIFIAYIALTLSVIKFDIDNFVTRSISNKLIIPAMIADGVVLDYFQYKDLLKDGEYNFDEANNIVLKEIVYRQLLNKYDILPVDFDIKDERVVELVKNKMIRDIDINIVGINRIRKIRSMILDGEDFVKTAARYGDQNDTVVLNSENKDEFEFSEQVKDLNEGEISHIFYLNDGYYIFKCREKTSQTVILNYVQVASKELDKYLDDKIKKIKVYGLIN